MLYCIGTAWYAMFTNEFCASLDLSVKLCHFLRLLVVKLGTRDGRSSAGGG